MCAEKLGDAGQHDAITDRYLSQSHGSYPAKTVRTGRPPCCRTRLWPISDNHTAHIAAVDLFVVPTIGFNVLYGLVILRLDRRRLVWFDVTANPTAEWIARQITEAFHGMRHRATSSVTATPPTVWRSRAGCESWVFEIGRPRHARRGRTVMLNG